MRLWLKLKRLIGNRFRECVLLVGVSSDIKGENEEEVYVFITKNMGH